MKKYPPLDWKAKPLVLHLIGHIMPYLVSNHIRKVLRRRYLHDWALENRNYHHLTRYMPSIFTIRNAHVIFILALLIPATHSANFTACLIDIQSLEFGTPGGTDSHGRPVSDMSKAMAITYSLCLSACGAGPEPFEWSVFSQQFSAWLLPWLALVSQLPFGANDKLDNLVSMLLTVGSPTLAAYSLALTAINGRWIARLFAAHNYPNAKNALRVLSSLQQSPVIITTSGSLLASLVVLSENDEWWSELVEWLNYTHTWSISAVTSILWVVIAYVFTVVDSFTGGVTTSINANGEGVGSLWLWLLPIVAGWLQISPKCDSKQLHQAIKRANQMAYVATYRGGPVLANTLSQRYGLSLAADGLSDPVRRDELCTPPIYNYARFLPWVRAVEDVSEIFRAASERARLHQSVDPMVGWETEGKHCGPSATSRMGTRAQIEMYVDISPFKEETTCRKPSRWGRNVWSRAVLASIVALSLQWGTTGAAIVVVWFTPTTGLGCRSGAYILYGCLSTIVWAMLVLSSFLSHYSTTSSRITLGSRIAAQTSIILRRTGKLVAAFNAIWIIVSCLFQFSNFFNRCYCNSSVLGWGKGAFDVLQIDPSDTSKMTAAWVGGVILAAGSVTIFMVFINLFLNPSQTTRD